MCRIRFLVVFCLLVWSASDTARADDQPEAAAEWPRELVDWVPYSGNPVFEGTGRDTWDQRIRERGYIVRQDEQWRLWYTGYNEERTITRYLGYATSDDGIGWR